MAAGQNKLTNFYVQIGKTINVVTFVLLATGEETFNNGKWEILHDSTLAVQTWPMDFKGSVLSVPNAATPSSNNI